MKKKRKKVFLTYQQLINNPDPVCGQIPCEKRKKTQIFLRKCLISIDKAPLILLNLVHSIIFRGTRVRAKVAQLVEQLICNQPVVGSIPIFGSKQWVVARVVKGDGL